MQLLLGCNQGASRNKVHTYFGILLFIVAVTVAAGSSLEKKSETRNNVVKRFKT